MPPKLDFIVRKRIESGFPPEERAEVAELLGRFKGDSYYGRKRVHWAILNLAKGSKERVAALVEAALTDYRDVLYWSEYCQRRE